MDLILFSILYFLSMYLSFHGHTFLAACPLLLSGTGLYLFYAHKYRSLLAPPAILSVSWIFCIGIANLKLSGLQSVWSVRTWLAFYLFYITFTFIFRLTVKKTFSTEKKLLALSLFDRFGSSRIFPVILCLTGISLICFITEAAVLGYVPLFTENTPHAYSYFHISGLHYFTVLCVLIPSFCALWFPGEQNNRIHTLIVAVCLFISFLLPVFMVSRFQLIFSVLLMFTVLYLKYRNNLKHYLKPKAVFPVLICLVSLIFLYILITVERAHSVEYLNGIFEMKDSGIPIFITQPYIYIVNNFENFDCLVKGITEHSKGLRMAFPFFALTGLKFVFPELISFPLYLTKEELTTLTILYDAYYDFGMPGCILFGAFLGFLSSFAYKAVRTTKSELVLLLYSQLLGCLILAFFTTWFSNPTTWFYAGTCIVVFCILWYTDFRNFKKKGSQNDR